MAAEGKKMVMGWKNGVWSAIGALAVYFALQMLNALLVAKEAVGEGGAFLLLFLSAGIAVLTAAMIGLRGERHKRLFLCLGVAVGFTAVILLCALLTPGGVQEVGAMIGIAGAAVLGGLVAAVVGGGGKKKRRSRRT